MKFLEAARRHRQLMADRRRPRTSASQMRKVKDPDRSSDSFGARRWAGMGRQGEFAGGRTDHSTVTARGRQYLPLDRLWMAGSRVQLTVALSASQSQVSDPAAIRMPKATVRSQSQTGGRVVPAKVS